MSKSKYTHFFSGDGVATSTPWYLAGGVDPSNCVAAYQAKGAADYATSKVNLANPGTHDLTDGAAVPTFDAATGWTFDGATTYLISDLSSADIGRGTGSLIFRFSNIPATEFVYNALCGAYTSSGSDEIAITLEINYITPEYGANLSVYAPASSTAGILAASMSVIGGAGFELFVDGVMTGLNSGPWSAAVDCGDLYIGAVHDTTGSPWDFLGGKIIAAAFYNIVLTPSQVSSITAAMLTI